jgi:hypothetical protein
VDTCLGIFTQMLNMHALLLCASSHVDLCLYVCVHIFFYACTCVFESHVCMQAWYVYMCTFNKYASVFINMRMYVPYIHAYVAIYMYGSAPSMACLTSDCVWLFPIKRCLHWPSCHSCVFTKHPCSMYSFTLQTYRQQTTWPDHTYTTDVTHTNILAA